MQNSDTWKNRFMRFLRERWAGAVDSMLAHGFSEAGIC